MGLEPAAGPAGPESVERDRGHTPPWGAVEWGRERAKPRPWGPGLRWAEAEGFEPSMGFKTQTALAVRRHRPD